MLLPITHTILNVNDEVGLYSLVYDYLKSLPEEELTEIKTLLDSFYLSTAAAIRAANEAQGSILTESVRKYEKRRDNGFVTFRDISQAITNSIDSDKAAKALVITHIIKANGWSLYNWGNKKQTATMKTLISDLSKPEPQAAISSLNILDYYTDMVNSHSDYLNEEDKRNREKIEAEKFNYTTVYKEMESSAKNLFDAINIFGQATGKEIYQTISTAINTIAEPYLATAKARKTRDKNRSQEAEMPLSDN